jgi:hypothetical protein
MKRETVPSTSSSLELYLAEINQFRLLTVDDEQSLARLCRSKGDTARRTASSPRTSDSW